jgi:cell division transport system permease protein
MISVLRASAADRRLLPEGRMAGPMPWVIAIMMFLTILAAAAGMALAGSALSLGKDIDARLTVQLPEPNPGLRESQTREILIGLRRLAAVKSAQAVPQAQLDALLDPWLGSEALDSDLPIPALIDVELKRTGADDIAVVRELVVMIAPAARVDQQAKWLQPLANLLKSLTWLALGLVLLMTIATSAAVVLAARAALNTHRATIDVLHLLGSTDNQIAGLFQRRIALDALFGGLAGLLLALIVMLLIGERMRAIGSELLGSIGLSWGSWALLFVLPLIGVLLSTVSARITVLRALRQIL